MRSRCWQAGALAVLVLLLAGGCATYSDRMVGAGQAASAGDYQAAIASIDKLLKVSSPDELPDSWGTETALATLERAILQQALQRYRPSARDLSAAEQQIELIDLKRDPIGTLGAYVYSDTARPYQAPPSERLALNAINLANYLAVGDLDGAAVEARRFQVMREYLSTESIGDHGVATLGAYLAGFVFERRGEGDRALRYYDEALAARPLASLSSPVARLAQTASYRGANLRPLLGAPPPKSGPGQGELLIMLALGRVPFKIPQRMPIGAAVGIAGAYVTQDVRWLTRGATKVITYPELVPAPRTLGQPLVDIDGQPTNLELLVDLGAAVRSEYEEIKPRIIAAAITRLAARAGVAEGVRAAGKQQSDALGELLAVAVEGALVALDKPDTRSWTMLPGEVLVSRLSVPPGKHTVVVDFAGTPGSRRELAVDVAPNGFGVVVVTEPR